MQLPQLFRWYLTKIHENIIPQGFKLLDDHVTWFQFSYKIMVSPNFVTSDPTKMMYAPLQIRERQQSMSTASENRFVMSPFSGFFH